MIGIILLYLVTKEGEMFKGRLEVRIPKKFMQRYLKEREKAPVRIIKYKRLGAGWHGTGYEIVYLAKNRIKQVILRTQRPVGFSHEYAADRAKVFLLQHSLSKLVPKHIQSLDVGGYTPQGKLVSIGECKEFFQIVEKVTGREYMRDLEIIKQRGSLTPADRKKALFLSNYLVELHKKRFKGPRDLARSIHRRHTRDAVGHGEMLMGVLDTYPERVAWLSKKETINLVDLAVKFRERIKDRHNRLRRMHGDFHPGNIIFKDGKDFVVLDASRELWGEPADDLTTLAINYIWYAVQHKGNFSGLFAELFRLFFDNYLKKTKDKGILEIVGLFFAFRGVVVIHPTFYPKQSILVRKRMLNFIKNVLKTKRFEPCNINRYLK
jgi:hypothetical protein